MNIDRALAYVKQAIGRLDEVEQGIAVGAVDSGPLASLRANLKSAEADLTPPTQGA